MVAWKAGFHAAAKVCLDSETYERRAGLGKKEIIRFNLAIRLMQKKIWPTSRGWIILVGGGIWFLTAFINQSVFAQILAWLCLSLFAVSFVFALFSLCGYEITREIADNAVCGNVSDITVTIVNTLPFGRQSLSFSENYPFTLEKKLSIFADNLKPRETRKVSGRVIAVKRGLFKLEHAVLCGGDPAGLFVRRMQIDIPSSVLVYPRVMKLQNLRTERHSAFNDSNVSTNLAGHSQSFYGIREYVSGDALRNIHWRSSAHHGSLMVREFEQNAIESAAILLDGRSRCLAAENANFEAAVSFAAGICSAMCERSGQLYFAAGGKQAVTVPCGMASSVKDEIMYELAMIEPGEVELVDAASEMLAGLSAGTTVFCIVLDTAERFSQEFADVLAAYKLNVRWICAPAEDFADKTSINNSPDDSPDAGNIRLVSLMEN